MLRLRLNYLVRMTCFFSIRGPTIGPGFGPVPRYKPVFEANRQLPNVAIFIRQINLFKELLEKAGPDKVQDTDPSFSLPLGEMFSIVVYGQLILEQAKLDNIDPDIINQIFDFRCGTFPGFALQIYGVHNTKDEQRAFCKDIMLIKSEGTTPSITGYGANTYSPSMENTP